MTASPRYLVHPSPVGDIIVATVDERILTLHPFDGPLEAELERIALAVHALPEPETTDASARAAAQLDEYFAGTRRAFELPLDWSGCARLHAHRARSGVRDPLRRDGVVRRGRDHGGQGPRSTRRGHGVREDPVLDRRPRASGRARRRLARRVRGRSEVKRFLVGMEHDNVSRGGGASAGV